MKSRTWQPRIITETSHTKQKEKTVALKAVEGNEGTKKKKKKRCTRVNQAHLI